MQYTLEDKSTVEEIPANYSGHVKHIAGNQFWLKNRHRHRVGSPAVIFTNDSCFWYFKSERHRTEGPAIEDQYSGSWWLFDREITSHSKVILIT